MKKFLVLYMAPASTMEEWAKTDPEKRKAEEQKMRGEWEKWTAANKKMLSGMTAGAGKTKRITAEGIIDTKNDVMLYSVVEADSHEAAAEAFKGHPHLGIPGGWIDIMPINPLPGMEGM
jgi:hypothetical protein